MNKKIFFLISLLALVPVFAYGAGLVPCAGIQAQGQQPACTLCHLFVLLKNIIDLVIFKLVPPTAFLMLVIAALMFIFSMDSPSRVSTAKKIISSVMIGLIIIYASYSLVGWMLVSIGLADWTQHIYKSWWSRGIFVIQCGD